MNFKISRLVMWIGFGMGLLIMAIGTNFTAEKTVTAFMLTGMAVVVLAVLQAFVFYVCPHCGYSLMNVRGSVPKHCPKCGKELI